MNSKNVFGQPRLRASLRDLRSPRRPAQKSTIEDDLKKLIIMDTPADTLQESVSTHTPTHAVMVRFCLSDYAVPPLTQI